MAPISKLPFLNIITDVLLMQVPVKGKHNLLNFPLQSQFRGLSYTPTGIQQLTPNTHSKPCSLGAQEVQHH